MRLAVLSDIHGNLPALEAVIEDFTRAGANAVVNLGDIVSGPLWPAETADRLIELHWPTIAGNHERQLLQQPIEQQGRVGPSRRASGCRACTAPGSPGCPARAGWRPTCTAATARRRAICEYFLETVTPDFGTERDGVPSRGARPATPQEALERAGAVPASLILCGHTHQARVLRLADKRIVVNPGSVGLQAYDDELPFMHYIEAGTPHARYALIECDADTWKVQLRQVSYDHEAAAPPGRGERPRRLGRRTAYRMRRAGGTRPSIAHRR